MPPEEDERVEIETTPQIPDAAAGVTPFVRIAHEYMVHGEPTQTIC